MIRERRGDNQIKQALKRFLKKAGRLGFQLRQLNELFKIEPDIAHYQSLFQQPHSVLPAFKLFILLHRLLLEGSQSVDHLFNILSKLQYAPKGQFQRFLSLKLMQPYRLYLQRRVLIVDGAESMVPRARVYQLMNVMNLALSFADIIYTFGRYYMQKFTCVIDFNIILGADLSKLYTEMIENVERPASHQILEQIETLHQKMYVVFYNCYFHRHLKNYIPKWVLTDPLGIKRFITPTKRSQKSESRSVSKHSSVCSLKTNSTAAVKQKAGSSDMADSCLFLNQKIQEQIENVLQNQDIMKNNHSIFCDTIGEKLGVDNQELEERFKLLLSLERAVNRVNDIQMP